MGVKWWGLESVGEDGSAGWGNHGLQQLLFSSGRGFNMDQMFQRSQWLRGVPVHGFSSDAMTSRSELLSSSIDGLRL